MIARKTSIVDELLHLHSRALPPCSRALLEKNHMSRKIGVIINSWSPTSESPGYCPATLPFSPIKLTLPLCSKTLSRLLHVPRTSHLSPCLPLLSGDDLASVFVGGTEDIWQACPLSHPPSLQSRLLMCPSSSFRFQQRDGSFAFQRSAPPPEIRCPCPRSTRSVATPRACCPGTQESPSVRS